MRSSNTWGRFIARQGFDILTQKGAGTSGGRPLRKKPGPLGRYMGGNAVKKGTKSGEKALPWGKLLKSRVGQVTGWWCQWSIEVVEDSSTRRIQRRDRAADPTE